MLSEDQTAPGMPGTSRARLLEMIFSTGTIHLANRRDLRGDLDKLTNPVPFSSTDLFSKENTTARDVWKEENSIQQTPLYGGDSMAVE